MYLLFKMTTNTKTKILLILVSCSMILSSVTTGTGDKETRRFLADNVHSTVNELNAANGFTKASALNQKKSIVNVYKLKYTHTGELDSIKVDFTETTADKLASFTFAYQGVSANSKFLDAKTDITNNQFLIPTTVTKGQEVKFNLKVTRKDKDGTAKFSVKVVSKPKKVSQEEVDLTANVVYDGKSSRIQTQGEDFVFPVKYTYKGKDDKIVFTFTDKNKLINSATQTLPAGKTYLTSADLSTPIVIPTNTPVNTVLKFDLHITRKSDDGKVNFSIKVESSARTNKQSSKLLEKNVAKSSAVSQEASCRLYLSFYLCLLWRNRQH